MRALLILRPEPGASATLARALDFGLSAATHPMFAVEPLAWTMPDGAFDGLLLTSANAVRTAGPLPDLPVHAVGQATADAARAAGARVETVGEGGVDDLLARLPHERHLLHLAGEEHIEPGVRGPAVTAVGVYRTRALPLPAASQVEGRVVLVHSPAAGRRLAELRCDRARVRVAAISTAAAAACGPDWERIAAAATPTDGALLSLAAELCKDQGR